MASYLGGGGIPQNVGSINTYLDASGVTLEEYVNRNMNGITKFGDINNGNYTEAEGDGTIRFAGNATVWDDLLINSGAFKFQGTTDPVLKPWQPEGESTTFQIYKFKKNDEIFFSCQLPHTYQEGTDIEAHVHWTPCDRGTSESGNYVGWKLDYSWTNINGDPFASGVTVDMSDVCTGTNDYHEVSAGKTTIDGTDKKISSMLTGRLYRSDTGADDTWTGTTNAQSPAVLQFDLHHRIDTAGSRIEWVK